MRYHFEITYPKHVSTGDDILTTHREYAECEGDDVAYAHFRGLLEKYRGHDQRYDYLCHWAEAEGRTIVNVMAN